MPAAPRPSTSQPSDMTDRPRRSALYMPGSNPRALEKGQSLPTDVLILDLEDAVAPEHKVEARKTISAALESGSYGHREILVRVNGPTTPWGEQDLEWAASQPVHGIVLPKVESTEAVLAAETRLKDHAAAADTLIWCMIETPRGVLNAAQIAQSTQRMGGLIAGTSDLVKDMRARHTADRAPLQYALSQIVLAARAAGIACLDGVHLDLNDDSGLAASCQQGLEFGFDGKTLIHPKQLEAANRIFAPSADEIAWAEKISAAFQDAARSGAGVVVVDGKLVEQLHVDEAKRLLSRASQIADSQ